MDVFREGKFELLALMETKLKGNEEVSWYGVYGINASVQDIERAGKGVEKIYAGILVDRVRRVTGGLVDE